jgi:hypothetical protein
MIQGRRNGKGDSMAESKTNETTEQAPDRPAAAGAALPPLYKSLRAFDVKEHAGLGLRLPPNLSYAAGAATVPLLLSEFASASRDYPIVFSADPVPTPVAVLGVRRGQNLFVGPRGAWRVGAYLPAYIRRHPFFLAARKESQEHVLAIDVTSPNVLREGGTQLVVDGAPSELAQAALRFCESYAADDAKTREFSLALVRHELLEPRSLTLALPAGKTVLKDLRVVAAKKLDALPDDVFLDWRRRDWLLPIYSHIQSAGNWQRLAEYAARLQPRGREADTSPAAGDAI